MGIFDYNCYIDGKDCPLAKSRGQEFTYGDIFAVNKKLTKKIYCDYSGYGYAELKNGDRIYDLMYLDYGGSRDDINDKVSYFACPQCAKSIKNESKYWDEFYEPLEVMKENIEKYRKELKYLIIEKDRIVNKINKTNLLLEKEKVKLRIYKNDL